MSSNIYSSNDDDIFEDYVEPISTSSTEDSFSSSEDSMDKVFSDIDSPFRSLLQSSSLKVNFGDAFYNAAYEWVNQGYRESNAAAIVETLAELTQGKFLYQHRLITSKEILIRKKTIIKFLTMMLEHDNFETVIKVAGENSDFRFNETYFNMFFRSFYNIQLHTYYCELAVYKSLCDMLDIPLDESVCDPHLPSDLMTLNSSEHINQLYIQYFEKDELGTRIENHLNELLKKKEA